MNPRSSRFINNYVTCTWYIVIVTQVRKPGSLQAGFSVRTTLARSCENEINGNCSPDSRPHHALLVRINPDVTKTPRQDVELQRLRYFSAGCHFYHGPCQVCERGAAKPQRHGAARAAASERVDQVRSRGQKRGERNTIPPQL